MQRTISIAVVADILSHPIFRFDKEALGAVCDVLHYDIDQHFQVLLAAKSPEVLISHRVPHMPRCAEDWDALEREFQAYLDAVARYSSRQRTVVILNTLPAPTDRLIGLDHLEALERTARLNSRLFELARKDSMVSIADLAGVLSRVGLDRALNRQNEFVMRMPYTAVAIPAIVSEYSRVIRERFLPRKKVVVVDADNTLWRGVVGEDGVEGIVIGSDYPGAVFSEFQRILLAARQGGVLLALVSKNNLGDVREVFERRDMPISWHHFTATRVNWARKSENIASIAAELDLGLDAFVFIDDNQFEVEEVSTTLPAVTCLRFEWQKPNESLRLVYRQAGLSSWAVTVEDQRKAQHYEDETSRRVVRESVGSIDEYIRSLEIRLEVGCNREAVVQRVSQLTNKTNQFNLTTRRYSEAEIRQAMTEGQVYDFRVVDRFGDMGIVGVVIVRRSEIEAFLMSCRALGREVEGNMLAHVCSKHLGASLTAKYLPTAKNAMVAEFYRGNGFRPIQGTGVGHIYEYVAPRTGLIPVPIIEVNT